MRIISADVVGSKGNPEQEEGRLIVISNRLPVTIKRVTNSKGNQEWVLTSSSGGLVSALGALKRSVEFVWVGWPGFEVEPEHQTELTRKLFEEQACVPVYLEATMADKYYNGFCNGTLWPLFHYQSASAAAYGAGEGRWEAYCQANAAFADAVRSIVSKGDIVWVHDYHLMLVPEMLRLTRSSGKFFEIIKGLRPLSHHTQLGFT